MKVPLMNQRTLSHILAAALMLLAIPAHAALRVFACEPEWGALARELGGDLVDVTVATSALQDPHQIQARPSLVARTRNADLVVCTGAELEVGWLPVLLQQSGNAKVQPGQPGNFAAADFVRKLDVPHQLDRSQGDIHAAGNPHFLVDPVNAKIVPQNIAAALALNKDRPAYFLPEERKIIYEYYHRSPASKGLPPGLAKKGKLPPGL